MLERLSGLACREVIDLSTGARLGGVRDAVIDLDRGSVTALIVPGRLRSLGLLGREEEIRIPWQAVQKIGEDLIFVRLGRQSAGEWPDPEEKLP
ncbi:MAG: YlmC/YmxH family sporulation protein [Clostridia bacterium]|jgi:sporulation protein, YlmC/YmxH family|nr:YlmC/YmxH family sporulation protein [Clostridia bacterium]